MAEIPRYKREKINAQVGTEKLTGMNEAAIAKGQAGIAQAQKGLSAQHGQRARQEVATFAQRLNQFSTALDSAMRSDATGRAQKNALVDVKERRKQRMEIQEKYAGDPKKMHEELQKVGEEVEQDNFSVYGKVYTDTLNSAYAAQAEIDSEGAHQKALSLSDGNPEMYKELYQSYRDEVLKTAPNEYSKTVANQAYEKRGIPTYEKMYRAKRTADEEKLQAMEEETIDVYQEEIEMYSESGEGFEIEAVRGKLKALLEGQIRKGSMSAAKAKNILMQTDQKKMVSMFVGAAISESNNGRWAEFRSGLYDTNSPINEQFMMLNSKQRKEIVEHLDNIFDTKERTTIKEMETSEKISDLHGEEYLDTLYAGYNKGVLYNEKAIMDALSAGDINQNQATRYRNFRDAKTEGDVLLAASNPRLLVTYSTEDIMEMDSISAKDKIVLIGKKDKLRAENETVWIDNKYTPKAYDRIKRKFGVLNDPFAMMSMEDAIKKDLNTMLTKFENQINALSPEEQADGQMILSIADGLISEYDTDKDIAKFERAQERTMKDVDKILLDLNEFNEGYFGSSLGEGNRTFIQQSMIYYNIESEEKMKAKFDKLGVAY